MIKTTTFVLALGFFLSGTPGCSKKQVIPAIVAGSGAALVTSGTIYRLTLPEKDSDGLFGRQPEQKATTATLLMGGLALIAVGIVWSATTTDCERDEDCWSRDRCDPSSKTCVPRPLQTNTHGKNHAIVLLPPSRQPYETRFQLRVEGFRTFF